MANESVTLRVDLATRQVEPPGSGADVNDGTLIRIAGGIVPTLIVRAREHMRGWALMEHRYLIVPADSRYARDALGAQVRAYRNGNETGHRWMIGWAYTAEFNGDASEGTPVAWIAD